MPCSVKDAGAWKTSLYSPFATRGSDSPIDTPKSVDVHSRRNTISRPVWMDLRKYIANVPDFPKPGILFRDITPLLQHPPAFRHALDMIKQGIAGNSIDAFAAIDARGFLIAAPLALEMDKPLLPVRKEGKLPRDSVRVSYDLEYGTNSMELHRDAVSKGQRVLVVDDLLATGGTAEATVKLVEELGGVVAGLAFLVELRELGGRERIKGYPITTVIEY